MLSDNVLFSQFLELICVWCLWYVIVNSDCFYRLAPMICVSIINYMILRCDDFKENSRLVTDIFIFSTNTNSSYEYWFFEINFTIHDSETNVSYLGHCVRFSEVKKRLFIDGELDCTEFDPPCSPRSLSNESYKCKW